MRYLGVVRGGTTPRVQTSYFNFSTHISIDHRLNGSVGTLLVLGRVYRCARKIDLQTTNETSREIKHNDHIARLTGDI